MSALPTVVLVGRPNVGKSTLFNRLLQQRRALMSDIPGTTRDWLEGEVSWGGRRLRLVDTGGYWESDDTVLVQVKEQVRQWIERAQVVVWLLDAREGITPVDREMARILRQVSAPVIVAVNKVDFGDPSTAISEFHQLGFSDPVGISADHGRNLPALWERIDQALPGGPSPASDIPEATVAIVGRPNTGKSSLGNRLSGEDRLIVSSVPGTTRDTVDLTVLWKGRRLLFLDTPGLRTKKGRASQGLEGLTRLMAERSLDRADTAVLLLDGTEPFVDGDADVARLIDRHRAACVVAVNKWDIVNHPGEATASFRRRLPERFPFLAHAPLVFLSAKTGQGMDDLLESIVTVRESFHRRVDDEDLKDFLWADLQRRPYSHEGKKWIMKGAKQRSVAPPLFILRGNLLDREIHFSFRRRVENLIRERYHFAGVPLILRWERGKA